MCDEGGRERVQYKREQRKGEILMQKRRERERGREKERGRQREREGGGERDGFKKLLENICNKACQERK